MVFFNDFRLSCGKLRLAYNRFSICANFGLWAFTFNMKVRRWMIVTTIIMLNFHTARIYN